jgi:hypothetical protein
MMRMMREPDLLWALVFEPGTVSRVQTMYPPGGFQLVHCLHRISEMKKPSPMGPTITSVTLEMVRMVSAEDRLGLVWIGKCEECGRVYYAAESDVRPR